MCHVGVGGGCHIGVGWVGHVEEFTSTNGYKGMFMSRGKFLKP